MIRIPARPRLIPLAIRTAFFLAALAAAAPSAWAQTITWTLNGVTFDDGGTASATIVYDHTTATVVSFTVSVVGGSNPNFAPLTYTGANSTASVLNLGNSESTIIIDDGGRQFRVTPVGPLDGTATTVAINTATVGGGGSIECFNCFPDRLIVSGSFVEQAVPVMPPPELWSLGVVLLLAIGLALRRRRASMPV